jgi:hypothetical protein
MGGVVFQVRERAKGNVTAPMVLWSTVMAVVLFLLEARWAPQATAAWVGVIATALFGIYLGWRRRAAAVFIAPFVSWIFAWFPLWVAAMVHDGVLRGLFSGLFLITIGWIAIGFGEFVWLGAVAFLVRALRGSSDHEGPDVVIFGPEEHR